MFKDKECKIYGIRENKKLPGSCTRIYGNHGPVSDDYASLKDGLLVMPGIAFDTQKNRIGYGGGFYDRYLQQHMSDFTNCNML